MPHTRSAYASIRGYVYQFDRTILEILQCNDDDIVTIEGIEDIDLDTPEVSTAVQCKYFEAQKFSLPLIRDAVAAMLDDSVKAADRQYRIYIHCGDASDFISKMDVITLRSCLTRTPRKPRSMTVTLYDGY